MIENHFDYNITREKITKAFDVKPGHPAYAPICAFLDYNDKEIREQYAMKRNLEMGYWNFISKYVYNKLLKFEYDTTDFANDAALWTALEKDLSVAANALYVKAVAGSPVPQITATNPNGSGTYAKVVKYYTVPNGGKGIKYQIIHLA